MSMVTDGVLVIHYATAKTKAALAEPMPDEARVQQWRDVADDDKAGGTKCASFEIWGGGFNYYGPHKLLKWFRSIPWHAVDRVVMSVQPEDPGCLVALAYGGKVFVLEGDEHPMTGQASMASSLVEEGVDTFKRTLSWRPDYS